MRLRRVASWPRPASTPRPWPSTAEVVRVAEEQAAKLRADAEADAAALRRETDEFIDSRMAGFESVLHKTASQVRTARSRLAERSGLSSGDGRTAD